MDNSSYMHRSCDKQIAVLWLFFLYSAVLSWFLLIHTVHAHTKVFFLYTSLCTVCLSLHTSLSFSLSCNSTFHNSQLPLMKLLMVCHSFPLFAWWGDAARANGPICACMCVCPCPGRYHKRETLVSSAYGSYNFFHGAAVSGWLL